MASALSTACAGGLSAPPERAEFARVSPARAATAHASPSPAPAGTYFVATNGSDTTGTGSANAPWRTITHAIEQAGGPGVTIAVRAGSYNERVSIDKSGSASGAFVIENADYPNVARIDGANVRILADGYAYGLVSIQNQSYVTVKGFEITDFKTTSDALTPAGIEVEGAGTNITLENNHITDIWNTGPAHSHDGACSGAEPQGFGLIVAGTNGKEPIAQLTIGGNELNGLKTGCSESMTVNGNVDHFTVTGNTVHDNSNIGIDAIGGEGVASGYRQYNGSANDQARDGEISDNLVYDIHSSSQGASGVYGTQCRCADGLYLDGSANVVVERNTVHDVDLGIEVTGEGKAQNTTDDTVRDNLFYDNLETGIGIGGTPGGVSNATFLNNTLYGNATDENDGTGDVYIGTRISGYVRFENTIVDAGPLGPIGGHTKTTGLTFDYNLYFNGASPFSEPHSQNANPDFVGPSAMPPNLRVEPGSPALERGTTAPGALLGPYDVAGDPRLNAQNGTVDVGAYQQQ